MGNCLTTEVQDPSHPVGGIAQSSTGLALEHFLNWYKFISQLSSAFYGISNTKICLHDCHDVRSSRLHGLQTLGPEKSSKLFQERTWTLSPTILKGIICIFPYCWSEKCAIIYVIFYVSWFRKAWEKRKTWFDSTSREEFKHRER